MNTRRSGRRIVLAYSGGLNASVAVRWLASSVAGPVEVVTVSLDIGQTGELEEIRDRALAIGAARAHVLDVRDEFAREYVLRALKADVGDGDCLSAVQALAAPLIARKLVEIADIEQTDIVAHGAAHPTAAMRLEAAVHSLNRSLRVVAPARQWNMTRAGAIAYAREQGIAVPVTPDVTCGTDGNLWGRAVTIGPNETLNAPPDALFTLTQPASACPVEPASAEIRFERGVPTALNGVSMPLTDLIGAVAMLAGSHGVGRVSAAGADGRDAGEAPAAVVLHAAHAELQKLVWTKQSARFLRRVRREYAGVLQRGTWFSPLREALDAFVDRMQERVSGDVKLELYKAEARTVGRKRAEPTSPASGLRIVASQPH
jgi:argininosuccinate synthase